jgi:hypothetical protein
MADDKPTKLDPDVLVPLQEAVTANYDRTMEELRTIMVRADLNEIRSVTTTSITHMTPEMAKAVTEVERLRSAVPAEEKTKRSKEETKREYGRFVLVAALALLGVFAPNIPDAVRGAVVLSGLGVLGAPAIIRRLKQSGKED